ncbi:hypothetical protein NFJ02_32g81750 [Pycnococcus provasolii]
MPSGISKRVGLNGLVVAVEPDTGVWPFLHENLERNNCKAYVVQGVLGRRSANIVGGGYGARSQYFDAPSEQRNHVSWRELQSATGVMFDTLLIDCEGCVHHIIPHVRHALRSGQIKTILVEADMPEKGTGIGDRIVTGSDCSDDCADYGAFYKEIQRFGFELVDEFNDCDTTRTHAPPGTWCGDFIWHYAFQLKRER